MINPNELRIGNKVLVNRFEDDEPWESKVEEIMDLHITASLIPRGGTRVKYEDLEPIPLTPEWLGRCGFESDKHGRWTGPEFERFQWFEIEEGTKTGFYLRGSEWMMGRPFQFLHQLQNLYHSLTGEELTIKELP